MHAYICSLHELDEIKLKQNLVQRKMKYNLHQMPLYKAFPPLYQAPCPKRIRIVLKFLKQKLQIFA